MTKCYLWRTPSHRPKPNGCMRVYYMNEQCGASNAKAKREFDWQPAFPSWRAGFEALYLDAGRGSCDQDSRKLETLATLNF
jgi:hypothetical protein